MQRSFVFFKDYFLFSAFFNTAHFHDRFFYLQQRKSYGSHMILFLMSFIVDFCKKIFSYLTISTGLFRLFAFCAFTYRSNVLAKVLDYNMICITILKANYVYVVLTQVFEIIYLLTKGLLTSVPPLQAVISNACSTDNGICHFSKSTILSFTIMMNGTVSGDIIRSKRKQPFY